ncbi:MAG: cache domain-containing protein [Spirochaetota bacterium]
MLKNLSFRNKLLLWVMPTLIIGFFALSLGAYWYVSRLIKRELTASMLATTGKTAESINTWLKTLLIEPETIASTPAAKAINVDFHLIDIQNINRHKILHEKYPDIFQDIYAANRHGEYHTVRQMNSSYYMFIGHIQDRPYFKSIMAGGPAQITTPLVSRTTGIPTIFMVAPIKDDAGRTQGLVGTGISLGYIQKLAGSLKAGKTGYGIVVDKDGMLIYHPDKEVAMKKRMNDFDDPSIKELWKLMSTGGSGIRHYKYNGQKKVVFYQPITATGWYVATVVPEAELFAPASRMIRSLLIITAVILILVAAGIIILAHKLTQPLYDLALRTRKIAAGNMEVIAVETDSRDEIGQLTGEFNVMAENLRKHREHLEVLVKERTSELTQSISLLNATIESTTDGILVVDRAGKIVNFNKRFVEMWHIPEEVILLKDDDKALACVLDQLCNPDEFIAKVKELYNRPEEESLDILNFKNGNIFERYSRPQRIDDRIVGRVWSFRDITVRRQSEKALERSYAILKSVVESPKEVVIFALDREYRYIAFNKNHYETMRRIWGADISLGISMLEYIKNPEDRQKAKINFDRALLGDSFSIIEQYGDEALERRYYEDIYNSIIDENGNVIGLTLFLSDITERKQAEEALRESRQILMTVLDTIPVRVFWKDRDLKYVGCNKPFALDAGFNEPEELLGKDDYSMGWREQAELYRADDRQVIETGRSKLLIEEPQTTPDGKTIWLITSKIPLRDSTHAIYGVLGTYMDITDYRKAADALRESEERFRVIFHAQQTGLLMIDSQTHTIADANAAALLLIGLPEEKVIGEVCHAFVCTAERGACPITDLGQRIDNSERILLAAGGEQIPVLKSANPINLAGRPYLLESIVDLRERKQMEGVMLRMNEKLEQKVAERTRQLLDAQEELVRKEKLAIVGQLAGIVGHEIRNPLGIINNAVYFLKTIITGADDTVKEYLDIIKYEIDDSLRIITDLLDFSRTRTPRILPVDIGLLIKETLGKYPVPENIDIRLDIPDNLHRLYADPFQMSQIFRNLIANAVQAMPEGGVLGIIARESQDSAQTQDTGKDYLEIVVSDTGKGISPENMGKLFQPLFTTKTKGIGLGLVTCKTLAEANEGRIEVKSELGKGTAFSVFLSIEERPENVS